jgi:hypothetical protein
VNKKFKLSPELIRGAALDNHAMYEARAESACSMGVGCGTAGVCYAERMGRPEMCGSKNMTNKLDTSPARLMELADEIGMLARFRGDIMDISGCTLLALAAEKEAQQSRRGDARAISDHIEQRLLTWQQQRMNKSGDRLALDDFMGKDSIDDLIDFVCDEYALDALVVHHHPEQHLNMVATADVPLPAPPGEKL